MRKVLLLSPHFDDAVLSAGQFMAGRPDTEVVTVFGGVPSNGTIQTPYDAKCGFKTATEAVQARIRENDEATALLSATAINWEFLDGQYNQVNDFDELYERICSLVETEDYEFILAPLGLSHPDHILLADAVYKAQSFCHWDIPVYMWEDLPLRVVDPLVVVERVRHFNLKELGNIGTGPIADKIRALSCYKSQIGTGILDPYIMYVPERFWKVR